jgi:hypothetical protein
MRVDQCHRSARDTDVGGAIKKNTSGWWAEAQADLGIMKRMQWSWVEYCALPVNYLPPLMELLKKEDADARRARAKK